MKYQLAWMRATNLDNYKNENECIRIWSDEHTVAQIDRHDGSWVDLEIVHSFEADNDLRALEYVSRYGQDNDLEVWVLKGIDSSLYATEEGMD